MKVCLRKLFWSHPEAEQKFEILEQADQFGICIPFSGKHVATMAFSDLLDIFTNLKNGFISTYVFADEELGRDRHFKKSFYEAVKREEVDFLEKHPNIKNFVRTLGITLKELYSAISEKSRVRTSPKLKAISELYKTGGSI